MRTSLIHAFWVFCSSAAAASFQVATNQDYNAVNSSGVTTGVALQSNAY